MLPRAVVLAGTGRCSGRVTATHICRTFHELKHVSAMGRRPQGETPEEMAARLGADIGFSPEDLSNDLTMQMDAIGKRLRSSTFHVDDADIKPDEHADARAERAMLELAQQMALTGDAAEQAPRTQRRAATATPMPIGDAAPVHNGASVSLDGDLAELDAFDWDFEAAAAKRMEEHMMLELGRLEEQSKEVDEFFNSDWHRTLGAVSKAQVERMWEERAKSGIKEDAVIVDRMIQRSEAVSREIHDEWLKNSAHMSWEDVVNWENPVWKEQREQRKQRRAGSPSTSPLTVERAVLEGGVAKLQKEVAHAAAAATNAVSDQPSRLSSSTRTSQQFLDTSRQDAEHPKRESKRDSKPQEPSRARKPRHSNPRKK